MIWFASQSQKWRRRNKITKPECNFESNDVWIKLNAIYFYILSSIQSITKQFTGKVNHQKLKGKEGFKSKSNSVAGRNLFFFKKKKILKVLRERIKVLGKTPSLLSFGAQSTVSLVSENGMLFPIALPLNGLSGQRHALVSRSLRPGPIQL